MELKPEEAMAILHYMNAAEVEGDSDSGTRFMCVNGEFLEISWEINVDELRDRLAEFVTKTILKHKSDEGV